MAPVKKCLIVSGKPCAEACYCLMRQSWLEAKWQAPLTQDGSDNKRG